MINAIISKRNSLVKTWLPSTNTFRVYDALEDNAQRGVYTSLLEIAASLRGTF